MSTIALGCLNINSSPLKYSMVAVGLMALFTVTAKPNMFYDKCTGRIKNLGTREDETLFPAWLAMSAAGVSVYMLATAATM